MKIELLDHMGSDLSVVNAARVSFDKESQWETEFDPDAFEDIVRLSERDTNLIHFLARENHWSPFAHCFASFRVSAPVFVARQLQKHTVGLAWNEVSRRYVDSEPTFYTPDVWRKRAENVKQGSGEDFEVGDVDDLTEMYAYLMTDAYNLYDTLLDRGVCPEQARMVLPQSMMTEWIWSGSLYAFARVCHLRLDSHTQRETQEIAKGISDCLAPLFPVSWAALLGGSFSDEITVGGVSSPRTSSTSTPSPSGTTTSNSTQLHLGL